MYVLLPCRSLLRRTPSRGCSSRVLLVTAAAAAAAATFMPLTPPAAAFSSTPASSSSSPHQPKQLPAVAARRNDDEHDDAPQPSLASQTAASSVLIEGLQDIVNDKQGNIASSSPATTTTDQARPASVTAAIPPASNPQQGRAGPRPDNNNLHSNHSNSINNSRLVYGSDDALFGCIERRQLNRRRAFGSVLDAGTGLHSVRWLASLHRDFETFGMTDFVGVTADPSMQKSVQREADALGLGDDVATYVVGNWFDDARPLTFAPESFDTILADYLIGAMDGFSPYRQDLMIPKLCRYLKPGGSLYVVGMEPLPDSVSPHSSPANVICRVRQVRDACILLAGHRCYREYPVEWMTRHLREACGDTWQEVEDFRFPILYRYETIRKQIDVGRSKLPLMPHSLRAGMETTLNELDEQCRQACGAAGGGDEASASPPQRISLGFDYVVSAVKRQKGT